MLTKIISYGFSIFAVLFFMQGTSVFAEGRIEEQRSYVVSEKRQMAICKRVRRRFGNPRMIERVNRRLERRFGFTCSADGEPTEEPTQEVREEEPSRETTEQEERQVSSSGRRVLVQYSRRARNRVTDGGELLVGVIESTSVRWGRYQAALQGDMIALYEMGIFASGTSGVGVETAYAFFFLAAERGHGKSQQTVVSIVNKMGPEKVQEGNALVEKLREIIRNNGNITSVNEEEMIAARNAKRQEDVSALVDAIWGYMNDNGGNFPFTIPEDTETEICRGDAGPCEDLVDMYDNLRTRYLDTIPVDPSASSEILGSRYFVKVVGRRVTVSAPDAEDGAAITALR